MKNIGNSLLPSSSAEILRPIPFKNGVLQVIPDYINDTHNLVYIGGLEYKVASHPNGFSCYELAERLVNGNKDKIKEQSDYIVRCGGKSNLEYFLKNLQ